MALRYCACTMHICLCLLPFATGIFTARHPSVCEAKIPNSESSSAEPKLLLTRDIKRDEDAWIEYATSLAFSEDGSHLVVGLIDYGGFVRRLLDRRTFGALVVTDLGKPSMTVRRLQQPNPFVVINKPLAQGHPHKSPNDILMVTWSSEGWKSSPVTVRLRTVLSSIELASVTYRSDRPLSQVAISKTTPLIILVSGGLPYRDDMPNCVATVRLWDVANGSVSELHTTDRAAYHGCDFSPDGQLVAVGGGGFGNNQWIWRPLDNYQGEIAVWEPETGELRYKTNERRHQVQSLSFSPDGRILATGGLDGRIVFRNADSGKALFEMKMHLAARGGASPRVESLAFSPNGKILAAGTGSYNIGRTERWGEVRLIDVEQRTIRSVPLRDHVHVPHHVAFSANGKMLAATTVDGKLFVWSLSGHDGDSGGE